MMAPESSAGPDGVGGQQAVWESGADSDFLWSDPENWSTGVVPDGADAVFTGQYNDKCIVDESTSETKIILTAGPGGTPFNAPIEVEGGVSLNIPAYDDSSDTGGEFNNEFLAANADTVYNGGPVTIEKDIDYGTGGNVNITNGASLGSVWQMSRMF